MVLGVLQEVAVVLGVLQEVVLQHDRRVEQEGMEKAGTWVTMEWRVAGELGRGVPVAEGVSGARMTARGVQWRHTQSLRL